MELEKRKTHTLTNKSYTKISDTIFIARTEEKSYLYDIKKNLIISPSFNQIIEDSNELFFIDSVKNLFRTTILIGRITNTGEVYAVKNCHTGESYDVKCSEEYKALKENLSKFKLQRKTKTYKKR